MLDAMTGPPLILRTADWYRSATRWTQLTLAEDDPVRFDPAFWVDLFERTRSNATCLSAGGYIAYYPSKVPLHYVSKYLGDSDPFGTLVDGARASSACTSWRGSIRMPSTRTRPTPIRNGSPSTPRQAAPALGLSRRMGDLRLWRLQRQIHARGGGRDHSRIRHRRGLRQSLAGAWRLLLRQLPDAVQGRLRP